MRIEISSDVVIVVIGILVFCIARTIIDAIFLHLEQKTKARQRQEEIERYYEHQEKIRKENCEQCLLNILPVEAGAGLFQSSGSALNEQKADGFKIDIGGNPL